jgi:hypothetical protein
VLRPLLQPLLYSPLRRPGVLPRASFAPASLFAAGEVGAWYDPSDLASMLQAQGTYTPVTAAGQAVGILFDKSKAMARGAELAGVNGDGTTTAAWGAPGNSGTWVAGGGVLTLTNGVALQANVALAILTAGNWYEVFLDKTAVSGGSGSIAFGSGAPTFSLPGPGTGLRFVGQATDASLTIRTNSTAAGSFVSLDNISVRQILGNHALQATAASRPTLQQDAGGRYYLAFDGTDDGMATAAVNFGGTDKVTVLAGVQKASDAAAAVLVELGANSTTGAASFGLYAPSTAATADYRWRANGSVIPAGVSTAASYAAPISNVLTATADIAGDSAILRVNGVQAASNTADQGAGNFSNAALNIGKRADGTTRFTGRLYSLIIRGVVTDAATLARAERWLGVKTGVAW